LSTADPEAARSGLSTADPEAARSRLSAAGSEGARSRLSTAGPRAGGGVSRLRIGAGHRLAAVDGLLTGLHEPEASHLDLLAAFLDRPALDRAYAAALASGYLWHEFGDVCLLLPRRS
jgi:S-adenosylmethionine:tRNA ribosyltransferase-isomerase